MPIARNYRLIPDINLPAEVDDVVSSVRVDREQMSAVWNRALLLALGTTPLQQFGIGFGVGW